MELMMVYPEEVEFEGVALYLEAIVVEQNWERLDLSDMHFGQKFENFGKTEMKVFGSMAVLLEMTEVQK